MKITLHCYIINYYLTQWTDNRMPDKRGTDNRGSTVLTEPTPGNSQFKYISHLAFTIIAQQLPK